MNPTAEPGIAVRCTLSGGRITDVALDLRRPGQGDRLAAGRSPQAVLRLFDSLYALCRHAQCQAAAEALETALGLDVDPELERARSLLRHAETIKEHALNILLQQDQAIPDTAAPRRLLEAMGRIAAALGGVRLYLPGGPAFSIDRRACTEAVAELGKALRALLGDFAAHAQRGLEGVLAWSADDHAPAARLLRRVAQPGWRDYGAGASAALPAMDPARLIELLESPQCRDFLRAPTWEGAPRETGSYAREAQSPLIREVTAAFGSGLLSRILARLVELEYCWQEMQPLLPRSDRLGGAPASSPGGAGTGLAQVEASRGRLVHHAQVTEGVVRAYQILAPTEWNFHPRGLVYHALVGRQVEAPETLRPRTETLLRAIDPCLDFRLEFTKG